MFVAFDTETHPIKERTKAPKLVCGSFADKANFEGYLLSAVDSCDEFEELLDDESITKVGHFTAFDCGVFAAEDPDRFLFRIFRELDAGRLRDTKIREQLLNLSLGRLKFDPETNRRQSYSLASLASKYLRRDLDKSEDGYRLRYNELDPNDIESWPARAREYAIGDAVSTLEIFFKQSEDGVEIFDEINQTKASFALHLMSIRGFATDTKRALELESTLRAEIDSCRELLIPAGLLRLNGSKNIAAIRRRISESMSSPPLTKSGKISTERQVLIDCGGSLRRLAEIGKSEKILSTYLPKLKAGSVHCRYSSLMETGRTSSSSPNIQNLPRAGGVRECYIPRDGYSLFAIDYSTIELRALAQICLDLFGQSEMARRINAGEDLHLALAAQIQGVDYDDDKAKDARPFAKVANFGYPGGMGAAALASTAPNFGLEMSVEKAEELRLHWSKTWPEMEHYFRHINEALGFSGSATIEQPRSKRVRGNCSYTQACNTTFQGLAADGAKLALFEVARDAYTSGEYYPLAFIHDEILIEAKDESSAKLVADIMIESMREYLPDIEVTVEINGPMARWSK